MMMTLHLHLMAKFVWSDDGMNTQEARLEIWGINYDTPTH